MSMASASRSSRSVVSTMSAASEDAVEPRAPIATPTVAAARAGASLTPSPTMTVTADPFGAHAGDLVGRGLLGAAPRRARARSPTSWAGSRRSPVSITSRCNPAARSRRRVRAASRRSGSRSSSGPRGSPSTMTQAIAAPSSAARFATVRAQPGASAGSAGPDAHPVTVHGGGDPGAGLLDDVGGHRQRQPAFFRLRHDRLGKHMRGQLIGGAARRSSSTASFPGAVTISITGGRPLVSVPVLSITRVFGLPEILQRTAAADDHTQPGRTGQSGDDRDRCGEQQRTWGGDHQHRDSPHRRAACQPGDRCDEQRQRQEPGGEPVGEADHRGALGAGVRASRTIPA